MTHVPTLVDYTGEYRRKIAAKIHTTGNARVTSKAHVNTIAVNVVIDNGEMPYELEGC